MDDWVRKQMGIDKKEINAIWLWLLSLLIGVVVSAYWYATISTQQYFQFQGIMLDLGTSLLVFFLFSVLVAFRRKPALAFLWLGLVFGAIAMYLASGVFA